MFEKVRLLLSRHPGKKILSPSGLQNDEYEFSIEPDCGKVKENTP